jgi:hypothetical protein
MNNKWKYLLISFSFMLLLLEYTDAQDSIKLNKIYYRVSLSTGLGSGYPMQESNLENGLGGAIEFAIQKNKNLYSIGWNGVIENDLFNQNSVLNSISSLNFTYGKYYTKKSFFTSISTGLGLVMSTTKGTLISTTNTGFLSSYSTYEKLNNTTIGIPISAKMAWVPVKYFGIGIEALVNINKINSFWATNVKYQVGLLREKSKKNLIVL